MSSRAEARRAKRDLNEAAIQAAQNMWTAGVLLAAVTVDTAARRGTTSTSARTADA